MPPEPSILEVLQPEDGGVAEHVLGLSLGLSSRGFAVEVAASPGNSMLPALENAGITVHRMPLRRAPGPGDARVARALRRLDAERRYDVVHAHSSKAGALVRAALPRRRRLVYTPHCFAFAARFGRSRALYWAVEQALLPRSGEIVAVCDWERDLARRSLAGARRKVRTIANGVGPCTEAAPHGALRDFAGDEPLAGLVSVLRPQKDPLLAVRAMAGLAAPGKPPGRLAVVGNGELAAAVQDEIVRLDVSEHVRWFPFEGDVAPYLAALDAFVMPSSWEAFPLAVLEAMRCGLPVAATRVGGVPEAVADGVTGRLVDPGDDQALAAALGELLGDSALRRRLGDAGREEAERRFDLERMIDEIASLYRRIALPR